MTTRTEHDSLGEVQLPAQALYGAQTARAVMNFPISGRTAHPELVRAYLRLKAAAAQANAQCGALPKATANLIERAVAQLLTRESEWSTIFPIDPYQAGAGTSQNMNANEVIANVANQLAGAPLGSYRDVHPNDHVNRSQSTNDTFPTAIRLAFLEAGTRSVEELRKLAAVFTEQAQRWQAIPKSARTHLQDAVPMTLGQEFSGYAHGLTKIARWLEESRQELRELGIGGSAAGTGLNVPTGYREAIVAALTATTGEPLRSAPDLCEAMQSQASPARFIVHLRLAGLELTRICNDLRLLSSGAATGLGELGLPAVQPGSSIMPGKVNPSMIEMANQAYFSVIGLETTVAMALQAGQLELNVMMPIIAYAGLEANRVFTHATHALRVRCVEGIVPNEARLRHYFESTPQTATALSPRLGYERTAKLVQEAQARGISPIALAREQKLLSEDEINQLVDAKKLTGIG